MTDVELQGRWFAKVTKPQLARYNSRMAAATPYRNTPLWDRERDSAMSEFTTTTREARDLYESAIIDIEATGEVSEETNFLMDQYVITQVLQAAE